jgi:hypothetical protein
VTGLAIRVDRVKLCKSGMVLKGVSVGKEGSVRIGTAVVRGKLGDLSKALQAAIKGDPLALSEVNVKVLFPFSNGSLRELRFSFPNGCGRWIPPAAQHGGVFRHRPPTLGSSCSLFLRLI